MNNQPTSSQQPSVAIRNYSFLVFYLVVLSALGSFVNDMYAPALPSMARLFGCSGVDGADGADDGHDRSGSGAAYTRACQRQGGA